MNVSNEQSVTAATDDFTKTWRYKVGLFMIVVGNLGILSAVLLGMVGLSAPTVGALVVGGEVVSLASIVFLGKDGFKAIKSKVISAARASYTAPVGKTRHYIGIALLLSNVVTNFLMMVYAWESFALASSQDPSPGVWGLNIEQQGSLVFWLFLIGEMSFLVGIYVLGADWWEKFRRIFVWESAES